jgi:hypothetical protein
MFGHQHSHNNDETNQAMQRAFMTMRAANNNNNAIPNFPPTMPPHMVQMAQEYYKNQMAAMQTNPNMVLGAAIPMQQKTPANNIIESQDKATLNDAIVDEDYTKFDIIKATQYGAFDRCRELIESGEADVNRPDDLNVSILHWAAINNRVEIGKYYIDKGAVVDAIGGDLQSTPLHWATRLVFLYIFFEILILKI